MSSRVTGHLSVQDAAQVLHCHPETVRTLIRTGRLPAVRSAPRGPWRIAPADLAAYKRHRDSAVLVDHARPLPETVISRGAYTGSAHGRSPR